MSVVLLQKTAKTAQATKYYIWDVNKLALSYGQVIPGFLSRCQQPVKISQNIQLYTVSIPREFTHWQLQYKSNLYIPTPSTMPLQ